MKHPQTKDTTATVGRGSVSAGEVYTLREAARELEGAIRAYDAGNKPNVAWWGVLVNRLWTIDGALNPERRPYGDPRRDDHFQGLPPMRSGALYRIRLAVDNVALTFGLADAVGRTELEDVLATARKVAAKADYEAIRVDGDWADELRSAVAALTAEEPTTGGKLQTGTGVAPRNAWFLSQYNARGTDTYHKPSKIHAAWDRMKMADRAAICPDSPNKITRATVVQAIKRMKPRKAKRATRKSK